MRATAISAYLGLCALAPDSANLDSNAQAGAHYLDQGDVPEPATPAEPGPVSGGDPAVHLAGARVPALGVEASAGRPGGAGRGQGGYIGSCGHLPGRVAVRYPGIRSGAARQ